MWNLRPGDSHRPQGRSPSGPLGHLALSPGSRGVLGGGRWGLERGLEPSAGAVLLVGSEHRDPRGQQPVTSLRAVTLGGSRPELPGKRLPPEGPPDHTRPGQWVPPAPRSGHNPSVGSCVLPPELHVTCHRAGAAATALS